MYFVYLCYDVNDNVNDISDFSDVIKTVVKAVGEIASDVVCVCFVIKQC